MFVGLNMQDGNDGERPLVVVPVDDCPYKVTNVEFNLPYAKEEDLCGENEVFPRNCDATMLLECR